MTLEEFAELVLDMRLAQNALAGGKMRSAYEVKVDAALLDILPDETVRSAIDGRVKRRTPRPDPMPTDPAFEGGPHGWW